VKQVVDLDEEVSDHPLELEAQLMREDLSLKDETINQLQKELSDLRDQQL
jgi:hypothetical protein